MKRLPSGTKACTSVISGVVAFIGCIIGDVFLVRWLFSLVPEGYGWAKILIVFADIWFLAGMIFMIAFFVALFVAFVTSLFEE